MEILGLLLFVGVVFVTAAVLAFIWSARLGTFDHSDRLALLPLMDDEHTTPAAPIAAASPQMTAPATHAVTRKGTEALGDGRNPNPEAAPTTR